MTEMEWSSGAVRSLVQEYQRRPELWDRHHGLFRASAVKIQAWRDIAEVFSCEVSDLRKKFNSVLASYRRERSKVKDGQRSGWFLYSHMYFLPGYLPCEPAPGSVAAERRDMEASAAASSETYGGVEAIYQYDVESEIASDAELEAEAEEEAGELLVKHEPEEYTRVVDEGGVRARRGLKRRLTAAAPASRSYVDTRILELQSSRLPRGDDCASYGAYVAAALRKHDHKTQAIIKQAINSILFEQEMNKYESQDALHADLQGEMLDPSD